MNIFRKVYIPLFIANLIPMFGVLFGKWRMTGYLFAYWVETYIISVLVILKYFLTIEERDKGLMRTLIRLLIGVVTVNAVLLAILALLLKSISWRVSPGPSVPLADLVQYFFNYVTQYNFILYALVPICMNLAIYIAWYIRSSAYRKPRLASQVFYDLSVRLIFQGAIIGFVPLVTDAKEMVFLFFAMRVALEVAFHEEKLERLDQESRDGVSETGKVEERLDQESRDEVSESGKVKAGPRLKKMNIKRFALLPLLLLVACQNSFAQQISHEELVEILGVRSWRVPLLKEGKSEWALKIINYEPRMPSDLNTERLDLQNKALIVVREMEKHTYQFNLKQRNGTSRGEFEVNICSRKEMAANRCDNSYVIDWYHIPMPYDDGLKYVIAEITGVSNKPVKQIILEPSSPIRKIQQVKCYP